MTPELMQELVESIDYAGIIIAAAIAIHGIITSW